MFPKVPKIEDLILQVLEHGAEDSKVLIEKIRVARPNTSKQAVYKALKKMRSDEVIVQTREQAALSVVWLKKLADFIERAELNYKTTVNPGTNFLNLKQGEKMSYTFKTFEATDMFWVHAFGILSEMLPHTVPLFLYNPHEWFLLARPESETFLFEGLKKAGKQVFVMAGNKDPLDVYAAKYFDGKILQYFATSTPPFPKSNYYVNVFGDFLIEVWLDEKTSELIDGFYKETKLFDENAKNNLLKIIARKGRNKLVINRNKRKADKIRNIFKKYF